MDSLLFAMLFVRVGLVVLGLEACARYFYWWLTVKHDRDINPLALAILGIAGFGLACCIQGATILTFGRVGNLSYGALGVTIGALASDLACMGVLIGRSLIRPHVAYGHMAGRLAARIIIMAVLVPIIFYLRTGMLL